MVAEYERKAEQFVKRSWEQIRDWWLGYVPPIDIPGIPPAGVIDELESVRRAISEMKKEQPKGYPEVIGLREGVLAESICLVHKAAHVLGASQVHFEHGLCSWSLMSAYQAAFFACKAVLGLLGVTYVEVENRTFLIDIWSERKNLSKTKRKTLALSHTCEAWFVPSRRVEHRPLWYWFQRMIQKSAVPGHVWAEGCVKALAEADCADFSRQRNSMQYVTTYWPLEDLHRYVVRDGFGLRRTPLDNGEWLDQPDAADFTVLLAIVTIRMATQLLRSLAEKSNIVKQEWDLLLKSMQGDSLTCIRSAYADIQINAVG
jgi:hypothetical protein